MQKAFPKVLAAVVCAIAYGVAVVIAVTGDGNASDRLWVVVVAVPVLLIVVLLRDRWRRIRRQGRSTRE